MRIEHKTKDDKLYIQHDGKLYKVLKISTNKSGIAYLINKKYKCYNENKHKWDTVKMETWVNGVENG